MAHLFGEHFRAGHPLTKVKWKTKCDSAAQKDKSFCYSLICSVHGEFSHTGFSSQELTEHHNTFIRPPNNSAQNKPLQARGGWGVQL